MTTPRDAIGRLSEKNAQLDALSIENARLTDLANKRWREATAARKEIDARSARVKELEAEAKDKEARYDSLIILTQENFARATRAEQERDRVQSELNTANDNHRAMAAQLSRIGQERDEALERLKPFAFDIPAQHSNDNIWTVYASVGEVRAAHDCVRRLAPGPDKEK